jgi:hypothetical protein
MAVDSTNRVSTQTGAVFLSYASEDSEAAERICDALRAARKTRTRERLGATTWARQDSGATLVKPSETSPRACAARTFDVPLPDPLHRSDEDCRGAASVGRYLRERTTGTRRRRGASRASVLH